MSNDTDSLTTQNLPSLVKEWMATTEELKNLSAEVREKRKRARVVQQMIVTIMKGGGIGRLTIGTSGLTNRAKNTKVGMTKKYIVATLTDYFKGDSEKAVECAEYLESNRPIKTTDKLSLES